MTDLAELIDLLDLAVVRAGGVAPPDAVARAADAARRARTRRALLTDTVVVALAGGTGSGKSSTLNALAGHRVASVSAFRPHTDEALAWIPVDDDVVVRIMDDLGIRRRAENDVLPGVAVIDMPDMDSVVSWHRHIVEELLPRVDLVVWVTDVVKYNDPLLHEAFLAPMVRYREQVAFVLNKVDLVEEGAVPGLVEDLRSSLAADGYDEPVVLPTAVGSTTRPRGIDELAKLLRSRRDTKWLVVDKLVTDIEHAVRALAGSVDTWRGTGLLAFPAGDPEERIREQLEDLMRGADVTTRGVIEEARAGDELDTARIHRHLADRALLGATLAEAAVRARQLRSELERPVP